MFAHFVQREQAFVPDGLADRAFGDAIAAAHLVAVGHGGGLVVALVTGVADVGFPKHQLVANVGDAAAIAQQLEVPTAIDRVAIQAGTDQLVVLDDEFLVNAGIGVAQHQLFGAVSAQKVSG